MAAWISAEVGPRTRGVRVFLQGIVTIVLVVSGFSLGRFTQQLQGNSDLNVVLKNMTSGLASILSRPDDDLTVLRGRVELLDAGVTVTYETTQPSVSAVSRFLEAYGIDYKSSDADLASTN